MRCESCSGSHSGRSESLNLRSISVATGIETTPGSAPAALRPLRPLLRSLEGLGVVARLADDLAVLELERHHVVEDAGAVLAVVEVRLHGPLVTVAGEAHELHLRRSAGELALHPEDAVAVEDLARLRDLDHAVRVTVLVLELGVAAPFGALEPAVDDRLDLFASHRPSAAADAESLSRKPRCEVILPSLTVTTQAIGESVSAPLPRP